MPSMARQRQDAFEPCVALSAFGMLELMTGFHGFHFFFLLFVLASLYTPPPSFGCAPFCIFSRCCKVQPNGKICLAGLLILTFYISAPAGDRHSGQQTTGWM